MKDKGKPSTPRIDTDYILTQSTETSIPWDLTEEDKQFLRSCNIDPRK